MSSILEAQPRTVSAGSVCMSFEAVLSAAVWQIVLNLEERAFGSLIGLNGKVKRVVALRSVRIELHAGRQAAQTPGPLCRGIAYCRVVRQNSLERLIAPLEVRAGELELWMS